MLTASFDATLRVIATNIREAREAMGLTQVQMSRRCGLGDRTLGQIESGQRPMTVETLCRIACALKCEARDLLP